MASGAAAWIVAVLALTLAGSTGGTVVRLRTSAWYGRNRHIQERASDIYAAYRSRLLTLPQRPRKLIFTCNSAQLCGGLGDRFKGLVSTFVLALLLDAEFLIDWEEPVPLRTFFTLDLPSDLGAVRSVAANATNFDFIDVHMYSQQLHLLRTYNFDKMWAGCDLVNMRWNGAVWNHLVLNEHLFPAADRYGLQKLSKRQVFEAAMHLFLAKPTRELAVAADEVLAQMARAPLRLGVQMRLGGGDWGDPVRYQGASLDATIGCFVEEAARVCSAATCGGECSVFLTTDSSDAQDLFAAGMAARGIPLVVSAGAVSHLEHSRGNASAHAKTFSDWYTLTRMHRLVASRSGFSETASWFGNLPSRALVRTASCLFSDSMEVPNGAEF